MLEVLQYATSGFWVFIGCFSLLSIVTLAVANFMVAIVVLVRGRKS